jgi:diguanylate cyclase (GGDEF)-like protein
MAGVTDPHNLPASWTAAALEQLAERMAFLDAEGRLCYVTPALASLFADPTRPDEPLAGLREELVRAWRVGLECSELSELGAAGAIGKWEFHLTRLAVEPAGVLATVRPAGTEHLDASQEAIARRAHQLAQANRELEALNEVALAVNGTLDLTRVLGLVLEKALGAAQIEAGWIRMFSEEGGQELTIVAHRGLSAACAAAVSRVPLHDSFAGKAVLTRKPIVLYSLPLDSVVCRHFSTYQGIRCLAKIPLLSRESAIGVLGIGSQRIVQISERLVHFLTAIGNQVGIAIANARLYEQVQRRAWLDPLTQTYNRQRFHELLEAALRRLPKAPPVLMVDLNHFKQLNDTLGHAEGDRALLRVAERLRQSVMPEDLVGRYGGDEFVVALLNPSYRTDAGTLPRLLQKLCAPFVDGNGARPVPLSLSIGVGTRGSSVDELLHDADQAMYVEKRRHHALTGPPIPRV